MCVCLCARETRELDGESCAEVLECLAILGGGGGGQINVRQAYWQPCPDAASIFAHLLRHLIAGKGRNLTHFCKATSMST